MKNIIEKTLISLIFLLCIGKVSGQDENRFVIGLYNYTPPKGMDNLIIKCENNTYTLNITYDVQPSGYFYFGYFYDIPVQFTLNARCGKNQTVAYIRGAMDTTGNALFAFDCDGNDIYSEFSVEGPAIIKDITFIENNNKINLNYACPNAIIKIDIENHGTYRGFDIECRNSSGNWKRVSGGERETQNESFNISNLQAAGIDPFQIFYIRTKRQLVPGNEYSISTSAKTFRYLPQFSFPAGKTLIVDPPACAGGNTILKIPYEGTTNYTLTVKGPNDWSWGENPQIKNCPTEIIDGVTYYKVSVPLAAGEYILNIENKADATPCPFSTQFTVPEIPAFHLSNRTYPDEINSYQIRKHGATGKVSFDVSGSSTQTITVHAGNETFSKTLPSSSVTGGTTYYNGSVSIDLKAGTYNIYTSNSSCNSDTLKNVVLTQPAAISFTATPTSPNCNANGLTDGNAANGKIDLSGISGGIGNYQYKVDGGTSVNITNNSAGITGLSAKEYTVTVLDNYGNETKKTVKIEAPSPITVNSLSCTAPSLWCLSDGTVTVNASGGAPPYQYSKENQASKFSSNSTVSGYPAGDGTVYVKDGNGCIFSFPVTIPATSQLGVRSRTETPPTCPGDNDGKCTLVMTNSKGTLSISGLPASCSTSVFRSTITISGLETGPYSCEVTDTRNGSSCSIPVTFNIPFKLSVNVATSVTPVSDKGSSTGKIKVDASGGNGAPFKITLFDGTSGVKLQEESVTSTYTFTGLAGEASGGGKLYRITVSDNKDCSTQTEVRVPEPTETLQLQATLTRPVSCYGNSDATVNLSAEGGWGEYLYSRDGNSWNTTTNYSGFAAGDYTFYVKDKYDGSRSADITVSEPMPLTIVRDSLFPVLCQGESTGLLRFRISGGTYPYTLSPETGTLTETITGTDTLITVSGLPAGNYTFTVKDSRNCTATAATETINEPTKLILSAPLITHTTCELDNGALKAIASGGVEPYTYTLQGMDFSYSQTQTMDLADTVFFNGLPPATYRITLTDHNACSVQSPPLQINDYTNPAISNVIIREVACFGENNGRIEAIPLPGTVPVQTFTIYNSEDTYRESNTTGIFENLYAGDYQIDVYDENECRSNNPYPVTVREPETLSIEIDTVIPVAGKGEKDGKIFFRMHGGNTGSRTVYLFNSENVPVDSLSAINNLLLNFTAHAGEYYMEVVDSKDCQFTTGLIQVTEPAESLHLIVRETKDALCKSQTGSIVVEGAGGWGDYRYKRAVESQFSTLNRFENLYPGNYLITVTDRMGATYSETITIHEPQDSLKAEVTALTPPSCGNNGSFSVSLSGGTPPYKLYEGNDTVYSSESQTVEWTGLATGAHLLHLVDSNGCRFELEASLPGTDLLKFEAIDVIYPRTTGASDGSLSVTVKGGTEPYHYRWSSLYGNFSGQIPDANAAYNLPAGYYHLEVSDAGGCTVQEIIYLGDPGDLHFTVLETGDETAFQAANGYAVLYSNATIDSYLLVGPSQAISIYTANDSTDQFFTRNDTVYLNRLESGKWFLSGTTPSGQAVTAEFEIKPFPDFGFGRITVTDASIPGASDGEIRIEIHGGGGENSFTWTDSAGNVYTPVNDEYGSVLSGLPAGTYTVEVTDRYGNRITQTLVVAEPEEALRLSVAEQRNQDCKTCQNAYVVLSASGGWGDYQFSWYAGSYRPENSQPDFQNTPIYPELETGEHWFYLIDKAGVMDSIKVNILEPEYLRTSVAFVDSVKCKDASDGRIVFDITGGTPPYSFMEQGVDFWNKGNEARNLKSGWHTFIFTDSLLCEGQDTLSVYVPEPDSLLFKNIAVTHTTCNEDNGQIIVALQGGTRPYTYRWLDPDRQAIGNDSIITGLKQNALYRLEVTDNNNCSQQMEQLIRPSTLPKITGVETSDVLCYGDTTGTARVTAVLPAEPYAPYHIIWSNGDTGESSDRFPKGQHWVTVEDENGCSSTSYFDIDQPDSLRIQFIEVREPHCYGYSDAFIHTQTLGGVEEYSYLWSTGDTTPHLDNITKGDYHVRVTDANGCSYEKSITLDEPAYQHIDLGEDVSMCPGNTHLIDGGDYVSYRWFSGEKDLSDERYFRVTEEGHYYLEAKTPDGCSAWGDISVAIGNNALNADLLLASEAAVGDTLVIFELSNLPLDSLLWEYDTEAFEQITTSDEYALLPYILQLRCLKTGIYNITLYAYSGGCYSPALKQVEVMEVKEYNDDSWNTAEPLITSLKQYPNPTNGLFTVEVELREIAEVRFVLFDVASGICINQRAETGTDYYRMEYDMQHLHTGIYVLIVTAGNERRQVKIIIE